MEQLENNSRNKIIRMLKRVLRMSIKSSTTNCDVSNKDHENNEDPVFQGVGLTNAEKE